MELYKNYEEFQDVIAAASNYYHVSPAIVEKDYFVTVILEKLNDTIPGVLFKGGTSLSKCFKVIKRFSEDIDLTLDTAHFTQSNKRNANKEVIAVCDKLGFEILNREEVENHSHGSYNCYNIEYPGIFSDIGVKPFVKLEMTFIQKSYPDTIKLAGTIIGEYLMDIGKSDLLPNFELIPFEMKVQALERTFVDKAFAICDYYLRGEVVRQSRHIYDLAKLMNEIDWRNLRDLVNEVRAVRMPNKTCLSAQPGVSVREVLNKIIETDYLKKDYEEVTTALLSEKFDYETAILSLRSIADTSLFECE